AAVRRRFKNFADLCLRVERDVARDFAERSADKAEGGSDFRHAIAMAVPWKFRQWKLQFFGKIGSDVQSSRTESRHGADSAAELQHEATLLRFGETRATPSPR